MFWKSEDRKTKTICLPQKNEEQCGRLIAASMHMIHAQYHTQSSM